MSIEEQIVLQPADKPNTNNARERHAFLITEIEKRQRSEGEGQLSKCYFNLNDIALLGENGDTLTRDLLQKYEAQQSVFVDPHPEAVNLTSDDLGQLVSKNIGLKICLPSGQQIVLDLTSFKYGLVIFPEDLGTKKDAAGYMKDHPQA